MDYVMHTIQVYYVYLNICKQHTYTWAPDAPLSPLLPEAGAINNFYESFIAISCNFLERVHNGSQMIPII